MAAPATGHGRRLTRISYEHAVIVRASYKHDVSVRVPVCSSLRARIPFLQPRHE
jgi:hypothetical protein